MTVGYLSPPVNHLVTASTVAGSQPPVLKHRGTCHCRIRGEDDSHSAAIRKLCDRKTCYRFVFSVFLIGRKFRPIFEVLATDWEVRRTENKSATSTTSSKGNE
jgi:hypothetical protein